MKYLWVCGVNARDTAAPSSFSAPSHVSVYRWMQPLFVSSLLTYIQWIIWCSLTDIASCSYGHKQMEFDWFSVDLYLVIGFFWVLIMCKHWSKLFLQVEVLNFSPVGISRCMKGEKFSCCSFTCGENMKSLISLITRPSICRKLLGTNYLCGLSAGGILTRFCNRTWKLLGYTNTHDMTVSTNFLRNPPEIIQYSSFISISKEI